MWLAHDLDVRQGTLESELYLESVKFLCFPTKFILSLERGSLFDLLK